MPRVGITAYDLLISCPGDVDKYVDVVKECIDKYNRLLGRINNAEIVGKHWTTDSYSQSGDKPQELLNKQFVRDCDAAVAIFWTKFGTPTDKYGSGTEEEIEEMLSAGKQVFMYFVDEPVSPSALNSEQYKKIQEFREKYKDRGIYFVVNSAEELEKRFTNDLTMFFLPLMAGTKKLNNVIEKRPILDIVDYQTGTNCVSVVSSAFCESKFIKEQEFKILSTIEYLSNNLLPERTVVEKKEDDLQRVAISRFAIATFIKSRTIDSEIISSERETILKFAEKHKVDLPEGFWNVGNLTKTQVLSNPMLGSGRLTYNGTDKEKDIIDEIQDKDKKTICFDLQSDMIIPFLDIYDAGEQFLILAGLKDENIKFNPKRSFINIGKLEGYNIMNTKRKIDELIFNKGCVFTYTMEENDCKKILEKLLKIENNGLGLRKNEGFGRIRICTERGGN